MAIAQTRTLGRAASQIGRTQAAVSMQVKKLEALLNQPLLNRTGRGVTLTLHGDRLLGHARIILRHHDAAVADISGTGLTVTLRFGCPDDYAAAFLPHILRSFAGRHPQVFVEVCCAPTPRLMDQLARHGLDLALISTANTEGAGPVRRTTRCNSRSATRTRSITARPASGSMPWGGPTAWPMPVAACRGCWPWCARARPSRC